MSDELLAVRPDLRELAETHAAPLISNEDRKLGVDLPIAELLDVLPEWSDLLGRHAR